MAGAAALRIPTIKRRSDFLAASSRGSRAVATTMIVQAHKRPESHPAGQDARIGYTVTKKIGNAVVRNRVRRRLRDAVRRIARPLMKPGHDYVIIARNPIVDCAFAALLRDMEFAFSRITVK